MKPKKATASHVVALGSLLLILITCTRAEENTRSPFPKIIQTYLSTHCVECHGPKKPKGKLRLDTLSGNFETEKETWYEIRQQLLKGEMPPEEKPLPPHSDSQQIIDWIARKDPSARSHELHLPKYGNRIDHASLFSGEFDQAHSSPERLWRLSPYLYQGIHHKESSSITQPFSNTGREGLQDYSADQSIDQAETLQLIQNARAIVQQRLQHDSVLSSLFSKDKKPDLTARKKAIQRQFSLTLLRAPSKDELARFLNLMDRGISKTGSLKGVENALAAVILHPEAVFRFETGNSSPDTHGRRMLSPRELTFAIAFALTDRQPDSALLQAALDNRLQSKEDVAHEVRRILENKTITKPRLLRFFREFFQYHHAPEIFKDSDLNPQHDAEVLVADTDQLILHLLNEDRQVLHELLTTNKSFINHLVEKDGRKTRATMRMAHDSYDLPFDWNWTTNQPVTLPLDQRAGILTQPSWLVAHSSNFHNHVILRGKWIREHLLGGHISDLPITVDAQLPDEPDHSLRRRMRVTRKEECWKCHRKMDPLGFTFESYDHFGRHRMTEFDKPVDSTGEINLTRDPSLHGEFPNAVAMIHHLAKTDRARQMFIRYAFRYWMGRNEELSDSRTLIQADQAYLKSNGSFNELLVSLLTSDAFLYRTSSP